MITENRKLWKLLLFTIPTFGIYNIYFWFRFTQDLNEMNQEEKKIKNYILVWFLSIITLGIYRWVWLFYIEDRLQTTGKAMDMKVTPGPGTVLFLWTFGKFILVGPLLADFFIIRNMNRLAKEYNNSFSKKTKVISKDEPAAKDNTNKKKTKKTDNNISKTTAGAAAASTKAATGVATGTAGAATAKTTASTATSNAKSATGTAATKTTATGASAAKGAVNNANHSSKVPKDKPKVVNKQVITPDKKPADAAAKVKNAKVETKPDTSKADTKQAVKNEAAAAKEPAKEKSTTPTTVTLDVEKDRPRADSATLTVNPGDIGMPGSNIKK